MTGPPATPPQDEPAQSGEAPEQPVRFAMLRMQVTQSVLVPPEVFRAYHELDPQLAREVVEHLMQEWLRQQAHAREVEKEEQKNSHKQDTLEYKAAVEHQQAGRRLQFRGQWLAAALSVGGFVLVAIALFTNNPTAAIWLGCSMVVALAGAFLFGRLLPKSPPASPPTPNEPTPP